MEVEEINGLKKLQLAGAIIVAYDGGNDSWVISESFCTRYGLAKIQTTQDINRLETVYKTKVVKVVASYPIDDRKADALKLAGYECS